MNAGCYGTETKDRLVEARIALRDGTIRTFSNAELGFAYRHCDLPEEAVVIEATFEGKSDDPAAIHDRMATLMASREQSQPIREKTGGSTFRNPDGESAWKLVDAAGGRGLRVGGAQMSEKHCNFMVNTGEATAADLETLGETIREKVRETSGHDLHWEIKRVGVRPRQAL
jgi:UDP-N-acetylmuramate dehydrogenase